ncbi:cell surface protein [Chlamydia vaughanii]|uniref:cell surface protein n=1 Tax=Chlamydia vaughanii TaxID=3112552 RepID=UPI0032B2BEBE
MVNPVGPGPIDESVNIAPADLSTEGMQASAANRSAEAQKIAGTEDASKTSQPSVNTIGRMSTLNAAKNALSKFFEKISNFFSGKSGPASFDEAKNQASSANTALNSASNYAEFKAAVESLQQAVDYMNKNASTDAEKTTAATWEATLSSQQDYINKVTEVGKLIEANQTLLEAIKTSSSIDQVSGAAGQAEENKIAAQKLIDELKKSHPDSAFVKNLEKESEAGAKAVQDLSRSIQEAYDTGKGCLAAVEQAKANNSPANIEACKKIIADAKADLEKLLQTAPDSPIVKAALKEQKQAETEIGKVKPSGGSDVPVGGPGAPANVGTSQEKGGSVGEARISMLLADADNETAGILLQGFRRMIDLFHDGSADATASLKDITAQVGGAADQFPAEAAGQMEEIQQTLQQAMQGATGQEGIINALGAITTAASLSAGAPVGLAQQGGSAVKQLYKSGAASPSSASYADSLSSGYSAYQSLNDAYAQSNQANRNVLDRTATPSLTQTVSRTETRPRDDDNAALGFARTIAGNSNTLGDVYAGVGVLQSLLGVIQNNPQANAEEIRQKLTAEVTKAPRFGYPYVQLSNDSVQKFIGNLEREFAAGSKRLTEAQNAAFQKQSSFIQQVLVNVASLFSQYLQ